MDLGDFWQFGRGGVILRLGIRCCLHQPFQQCHVRVCLILICPCAKSRWSWLLQSGRMVIFVFLHLWTFGCSSMLHSSLTAKPWHHAWFWFFFFTSWRGLNCRFFPDASDQVQLTEPASFSKHTVIPTRHFWFVYWTKCLCDSAAGLCLKGIIFSAHCRGNSVKKNKNKKKSSSINPSLLQVVAIFFSFFFFIGLLGQMI